MHAENSSNRTHISTSRELQDPSNLSARNTGQLDSFQNPGSKLKCPNSSPPSTTMAADLISHHYCHSAPIHHHRTLLPEETITHRTTDSTFFTLFNDAPDEIRTPRRSWLLINNSDSIRSVYFNAMREFLGNIPGECHLTISSFDKSILLWAHSSAVDRKSVNVSVDLLHEMKLQLPKAVPGLAYLPSPWTVAGLALEKDGFRIEEDPEWFATFKPEEKSIVSCGGERVWTVVEVETLRKAAFVSVLVAQGGKRLYVSSLETFPDYRRKGLARALMRHVHELHAKEGGTECWLTVFCENWSALEMYHKLGYRTNRCLWVVNYDDEVGDEV